MKSRNGFVSNSSSSSFVLDMSELLGWQVELIWNHADVARVMLNPLNVEAAEMGDYGTETYFCEEHDSWNIEEFRADGTNCMFLGTSMDNFDMDRFLREIRANHAIIFEGDCEHLEVATNHFREKAIEITLDKRIDG